MRVVLLSLLAAFLALALGVAAHHTITTEHFGFGIACLLATCLVCSGIGLVAFRAAKKESRWWLKMISGAVLLAMVWVYLQLVFSPYFPLSLKIAHAITSGVLLLWAVLLITAKPSNAA